MGPAAAIIAGSHSGMSSNSSREAERVPDEGIEPSNARSKRAVMPLNEPAQWRTLRELNSPLLREKQMSLPIDDMVRAAGIEPTLPGWKPSDQPMTQARERWGVKITDLKTTPSRTR